MTDEEGEPLMVKSNSVLDKSWLLKDMLMLSGRDEMKKSRKSECQWLNIGTSKGYILFSILKTKN